MKRILIYLGILAAVVAAPVRPLNIDQLLPVQVVSIYKEGARIVIETDTENKGIGLTATQALQNLKDTASGTIYLDTAQYLLLTKDAVEAVEELREELKASVQMCLATDNVNLEKVAIYLNAHGPLPRLKEWEKGVELPILSKFEES